MVDDGRRIPGGAPQADRLEVVRAVVGQIATGVRTDTDLASACGVAPRYARYCVHAARLLDLVQGVGEALTLTERGAALLKTVPVSGDEHRVLLDAILVSPAFQPFVGSWVKSEPSVSDLAGQLEK